MKTFRRGTTMMSPTLLAELLQLPKGVEIIDMVVHRNPLQIELLLEGDVMPEVLEDCQARYISFRFTRVESTQVKWGNA